MPRAHLSDIAFCLASGGLLRFRWKDCSVWLIFRDSATNNVREVDARSYQAFLHLFDDRYQKNEFGSTDTEDLIIEWRQFPK
jgi:hypothetical protein